MNVQKMDRWADEADRLQGRSASWSRCGVAGNLYLSNVDPSWQSHVITVLAIDAVKTIMCSGCTASSHPPSDTFGSNLRCLPYNDKVKYITGENIGTRFAWMYTVCRVNE